MGPMLNRVVLGVLFGVVGGALSAQAQSYAPEPHLKLGFDMEFMPRNFAPLVAFMDLDYLALAVDREKARDAVLSPQIVKDYVLNPQALAALPAKLRAELTQDLDLSKRTGPLRFNSTLLNAQGEKYQGTRLIRPSESHSELSSSASSLRRQEGLILPEAQKSSLIRPDVIQDVKQQTQDHLRSDWSVLNTRWNNLPYDQQKAAVDVRYLSPVRLAEVVSRWPLEFYDVKNRSLDFFIRWKPHTPVFLQELVFTLDVGNGLNHASGDNGLYGQRVIEAALHEPSPVNKGLDVIDQLLRSTYTKSLLDKPHEQKRMDISFHLHVGLDELASPELVKHFHEVMESYNKLLLFRLLTGGTQNDSVLDPEQLNSFKLFLTKGRYGLVKMVDTRHFEIRELTAQPEIVFAEILDYLRNTDSATARMQTEIQKIAKKDPSVITRIKNFRPQLLFAVSDLVTRQEIFMANLLKLQKSNTITAKNNLSKTSPMRLLADALSVYNSFENFLILVELREALPQWRPHLGSLEMLSSFIADEETLKDIEEFATEFPERVWPELREALISARTQVDYEPNPSSILSPGEPRLFGSSATAQESDSHIRPTLSNCLRILHRN